MKSHPKTRLSSNPDSPDGNKSEYSSSCFLSRPEPAEGSFFRSAFSFLLQSLPKNPFSLLLLSFSLLYAQPTLGDLNQDELINVNDILRTVNIILEIPPLPTESEQINGDLNVDSEINIQDILIIVDIIIDNLDNYCTDDQWDIPCETNYSECCYPITSHEFEWEIDTFGVGANAFSELHDAFIINENDIWVAGTVLWSDTSTSIFYNALHWNGTEWEGVQIIDQNGICNWGFSFFAFNPTDMWFGSTRPHHFDGESWFKYGSDEGFPSNLSHPDKIWGTSFDNMFFFQRTADIVHFDGIEFTTMETSTGSGDGWNSNENFKSIIGIDENHIWALTRGSIGDPMDDYPHTIQFFDGDEWTDLYRYDYYFVDDDTLSPYFYNLWQFGDTLYVMSGDGLWKESIITGLGHYTELDSGIHTPPNFVVGKGLVGNHPNDIITISWQGSFAHYNGENWDYNLDIYEFLEENTAGAVRGIAYKEETLIIHGDFYGFDSPVWIARGTRIE